MYFFHSKNNIQMLYLETISPDTLILLKKIQSLEAVLICLRVKNLKFDRFFQGG